MLQTKPTWWTGDHWATPPQLVTELEAEFGAFDLDPCCRVETAKARKFYTEVEDGLSQPWLGRVFVNPPFSKPRPWLEKAVEETRTGNASLVVALLPVKSDTRWWHELVLNAAEMRFIKGRIRWIGWQGTPIPQPIPQPSMFAIYRKK